MIITIEELMRKLNKTNVAQEKRVSKDTMEEALPKSIKQSILAQTTPMQSYTLNNWDTNKINDILIIQRPEYFTRSSPKCQKKVNNLTTPSIRAIYM